MPFILPRVSPSEQRRRKTIDGIATVLISYVVDRLDDSQHQSTSAPDAEPHSASIPSSDSSMQNEAMSMRDSDESNSVVSYVSSINVPFEAHVLPGHGRRFSAVLPIICVADEDNIISLLSSVLYQRHVWEIDEPVVGVVFSPTGTVGQVILGWLDLESYDEENLVRVNCIIVYDKFHIILAPSLLSTSHVPLQAL